MSVTPAEAVERLSEALRKLVPHFPFDRNGTLYCDCGWHLDNGGKLDWWAHVEEANGLPKP